ncbi:thioredoxin family protein [Trinickia acidisoli]|uniref:thioredoxin family protein n=1 Tax=Trinickia acidisoli TaxID=2767482 RepID=UPI001A8EA6A0|nr:thioredoxin family protein [Trinickia acidisoli]
MRKSTRHLGVFAVLVLVAAAAASVVSKANGVGAPAAMQGTAPEFTGIDHWLNSPPLTMQSLRGKVVLVDFWTYGCINCFHTLPYVKEWDQRYRNKGLTVIGIHTPETPDEHSTANLKDAIQRYGIRYPVAQDNDYATWNAYGNQYWPAFYLIDKKGHIVYTHVGEGQYRETEAWIEKLLAEKD